MTHSIHIADSLLADQVSVWRKEIARLNDLIAHAAGAPIHSADAERKVIAAQFKTWIMSDDYEQGETAAYVAGWRHSRAAAQVGANGAAESMTDKLQRLQGASVKHIASLAAGAPAETLKPDLHDAIMNIPCPANPPFPFSSGPVAIDQLRAYKEGHRDARHAAAELAATIGAGEGKDAARLDWLDSTNARFRMGWQVGCAPAGNVSVKTIITGGTTIRAAIDAAVRSKTSPGEAG